jgi:hypothetical protein
MLLAACFLCLSSSFFVYPDYPSSYQAMAYATLVLNALFMVCRQLAPCCRSGEK